MGANLRQMHQVNASGKRSHRNCIHNLSDEENATRRHVRPKTCGKRMWQTQPSHRAAPGYLLGTMHLRFVNFEYFVCDWKHFWRGNFFFFRECSYQSNVLYAVWSLACRRSPCVTFGRTTFILDDIRRHPGRHSPLECHWWTISTACSNCSME